MAKSNRVFVSFAVEDKTYRDFFVGQAKNNRTPFEFVDMSVKEPWDDAWKTNCRIRVKGCDGMIALVSKKHRESRWQLWEVGCAKEERVPIRGIYVDANNRPTTLPTDLVEWT